jgi:hypothetical protein
VQPHSTGRRTGNKSIILKIPPARQRRTRYIVLAFIVGSYMAPRHLNDQLTSGVILQDGQNIKAADMVGK